MLWEASMLTGSPLRMVAGVNAPPSTNFCPSTLFSYYKSILSPSSKTPSGSTALGKLLPELKNSNPGHLGILYYWFSRCLQLWKADIYAQKCNATPTSALLPTRLLHQSIRIDQQV